MSDEDAWSYCLANALNNVARYGDPEEQRRNPLALWLHNYWRNIAQYLQQHPPRSDASNAHYDAHA